MTHKKKQKKKNNILIKFHLFLKPYGAMCSVTKKKKHKKKTDRLESLYMTQSVVK